jgi:8-oxo-dGTP pyrophosphatase MutT (NUDIX family)
MLSVEAETEINGLSERFGRPSRRSRDYPVPLDQAGWVRKMLKRSGEVIFVVAGAKGRVWLHTKTFYPHGVFRLPSGGIHAGESIEHAAYRELYEELGSRPGLVSFLGIVENRFDLEGDRLLYPTFILGTAPLTVAPQVTDPNERIAEFREFDVKELTNIASQLDSVDPEWQPWGHFRAFPHSLVAQALLKDAS